jgi:hypothetical protein
MNMMPLRGLPFGVRLTARLGSDALAMLTLGPLGQPRQGPNAGEVRLVACRSMRRLHAKRQSPASQAADTHEVQPMPNVHAPLENDLARERLCAKKPCAGRRRTDSRRRDLPPMKADSIDEEISVERVREAPCVRWPPKDGQPMMPIAQHVVLRAGRTGACDSTATCV